MRRSSFARFASLLAVAVIGACGDDDPTDRADASTDVGDVCVDATADGSGAWTPPGCGDAVVDEGETCDPPGACPGACPAPSACFESRLVGRAEWCTSECVDIPIVACVDDDGCCPAGCAPDDDTDCPGTCGNGELDAGEACDPADTCPTSCDDGRACTTDTLRGAAESCTAECVFEVVTSCEDGDG